MTQKYHFFMSLFDFDQTDRTLREFDIRYFPFSKLFNQVFSNIVPTLLEVFFDLHGQFFYFLFFWIPLINPDLEMRILCKKAIVPAIDFDLKTDDVKQFLTHLALVHLVLKKMVSVTFYIAPLYGYLLNQCLYLNNVCYNVTNYSYEVNLQADIYSIYFVANINNTLDTSHEIYEIFKEDTQILIPISKVECDPFLRLIYYNIDAHGYNDIMFMRIFVNYRKMNYHLSIN